MKILSLIVPCYNSANYMERCINSLLLGKEAVEIIIVNDGSQDRTAEIADHYANYFPETIKAVHQENGGHGQAINAGLEHATGYYIKVVDSDDWLDANAYQQVLQKLTETVANGCLIDMLISNYVYEKQGVKNKKVISYESFLPVDQGFSWEDVRFPLGKYLLMHSVIYRSSILKELALKLPQHTFYVDNLYIFQPLPLVKQMHYLNVDLYRYFIGREDQSVNEQVMIQRIDQQLAVNKRMVAFYSDTEVEDESLLKYMQRYVEIITTVSSIFLIKEGSPDSMQKKQELWEFIKESDPVLYRRLRRGLFGLGVNLPGKLGRKTAIGAYQIAKRVYGFN
ncbi:glycosyltransferase family 2 protein [Enterococcus thailandicus]|uniref:Glycosyl transferase n=1 Tax=Enterococcus thailandicus TaxID=417368 RepID=A0A510WFT4_ENTTH|nr:glycosyltransferase [Enterococcus thailandicus]GEK37996.1 glycosyl transferase [Enterococcus thailandicus]